MLGLLLQRSVAAGGNAVAVHLQRSPLARCTFVSQALELEIFENHYRSWNTYTPVPCHFTVVHHSPSYEHVQVSRHDVDILYFCPRSK